MGSLRATLWSFVRLQLHGYLHDLSHFPKPSSRRSALLPAGARTLLFPRLVFLWPSFRGPHGLGPSSVQLLRIPRQRGGGRHLQSLPRARRSHFRAKHGDIGNARDVGCGVQRIERILARYSPQSLPQEIARRRVKSKNSLGHSPPRGGIGPAFANPCACRECGLGGRQQVGCPRGDVHFVAHLCQSPRREWSRRSSMKSQSTENKWLSKAAGLLSSFPGGGL